MNDIEHLTLLTITEDTVWNIVTVLEPLKIRLDHTGGVAGDHTVLAHVHSVLETKLICHFSLGTFAQTHAV